MSTAHFSSDRTSPWITQQLSVGKVRAPTRVSASGAHEEGSGHSERGLNNIAPYPLFCNDDVTFSWMMRPYSLMCVYLRQQQLLQCQFAVVTMNINETFQVYPDCQVPAVFHRQFQWNISPRQNKSVVTNFYGANTFSMLTQYSFYICMFSYRKRNLWFFVQL